MPALPSLHTKADFSVAESRKGDSAKKKMAYALGNEISDLLVTTPTKAEITKARHISGQASTFLYKTAIVTRGTRAPACGQV